MLNKILTTVYAVRFNGDERHIVSLPAGKGYAETWTPDTYAILYVVRSHRGFYSVVKRTCTSTRFYTDHGVGCTAEAALERLLGKAARLRPRAGILPVRQPC